MNFDTAIYGFKSLLRHLIYSYPKDIKKAEEIIPDLPKKDFLPHLRHALTGEDKTPPIAELLITIDENDVIKRLTNYMIWLEYPVPEEPTLGWDDVGEVVKMGLPREFR